MYILYASENDKILMIFKRHALSVICLVSDLEGTKIYCQKFPTLFSQPESTILFWTTVTNAQIWANRMGIDYKILQNRRKTDADLLCICHNIAINCTCWDVLISVCTLDITVHNSLILFSVARFVKEQKTRKKNLCLKSNARIWTSKNALFLKILALKYNNHVDKHNNVLRINQQYIPIHTYSC